MVGAKTEIIFIQAGGFKMVGAKTFILEKMDRSKMVKILDLFNVRSNNLFLF